MVSLSPLEVGGVVLSEEVSNVVEDLLILLLRVSLDLELWPELLLDLWLDWETLRKTLSSDGMLNDGEGQPRGRR
jgi:hypothetical protein